MYFCSVFLVVTLGLLGVNTGLFCWGLLQFWWFGVYGVCFVRFIFFLILMCIIGILMCIIGVSVFVDFFIKICIILVFFWCLSCFCLWLVLLAQVVWFIVVFCFVVMFVFYDSVIKCLIFLLAISTVSINDFYFCNFFVIFTTFFKIFLVFIIKKHQIFLVQIYFTVYFILMCCIPSSSKGSEVVTNPNFS